MNAPGIKSIMPAQPQKGRGGWNVRCRLRDGREVWLLPGAPYTLAQAQMAADAARHNAARGCGDFGAYTASDD